MLVAIHQPNLFPRLKTLQKLAIADVWIVLDDVQYCRREYQNRTYIVPLRGENYWCSLPVKLCNGQNTKIKDVKFAFDNSMSILQNTFKHSYKNDAEQKCIFDSILMQMENKSQSNFTEFIVESGISLLRIAGFSPQVIYSSTINNTPSGKSERLAALCKTINADTYIADSGGVHYIEESVFEKYHINILWQVWAKPCQSSVESISGNIRNGSGLNVLARSRSDFVSIVSQSILTKRRYFAEGK